jgi:hypothetical protein
MVVMCIFFTAGPDENIPDEFIPTTPSFFTAPGNFSGGTVGGVKADTLGFGEGLIFSGFSFTGGTNPNNFGSGLVTFSGDLTGYIFSRSAASRRRPAVGPEVFKLHLGGGSERGRQRRVSGEDRNRSALVRPLPADHGDFVHQILYTSR